MTGQFCICGDPLDRHQQFDPHSCKDCDCRAFRPRTAPGVSIAAQPAAPPIHMNHQPQRANSPIRHVTSSNWIFMDGNLILENLCDHAIVLRDDEGNEVTLLASPRPARCGIEKKQTALVNLDNKVMLPVFQSQFSDVQNVPAPDPRRKYIVPLPVAKRLPLRGDLFCVDGLRRGPSNEVMYACALARPL